MIVGGWNKCFRNLSLNRFPETSQTWLFVSFNQYIICFWKSTSVTYTVSVRVIIITIIIVHLQHGVTVIPGLMSSERGYVFCFRSGVC